MADIQCILKNKNLNKGHWLSKQLYSLAHTHKGVHAVITVKLNFHFKFTLVLKFKWIQESTEIIFILC